MQREIKFRAFDKGANKMHYNVAIVGKRIIAEYSFTGEEGDFIDCKTYAPDHIFILMQFTGMMDKNKRGIYESDKYKDSVTGIIFEVKFYQGCFFFDCGDDNLEMPLHMIELWERLDYIGNIYENSELLNSNNK